MIVGVANFLSIIFIGLHTNESNVVQAAHVDVEQVRSSLGPLRWDLGGEHLRVILYVVLYTAVMKDMRLSCCVFFFIK
jgi:hypothetical protein